jgi:aromatic ring-opening dioxygenase catalytic subunit (LigB family)
MPERFPAIYIPHGGGPWPFVETGFGPRAMWEPLETYLRSLVTGLSERPRAILVSSAHWEEPQPTLMTGARPPMLYDYGGFPPEAYELRWDAPGPDTTLVRRAQELLAARGFSSALEPRRGFDHGTFVPLKVALPEPDIPVLQVSLLRGLDPKAHIELGAALAPFRDEGVVFIGSGMSYHNMRGFFRGDAQEHSRLFDAWLEETTRLPAGERNARLARWTEAPAARQCHPREEHLLPLHVMSGAAPDSRGEVVHRSEILGVTVSAIQFD